MAIGAKRPTSAELPLIRVDAHTSRSSFNVGEDASSEPVVLGRQVTGRSEDPLAPPSQPPPVHVEKPRKTSKGEDNDSVAATSSGGDAAEETEDP